MATRGGTEGDGGEASEAAYARARSLFAAAAVAIALGLGVAGSLDRAIGGAVALAGWGVAILALHRLGRAGSSR